jgi:hypothetical protein
MIINKAPKADSHRKRKNQEKLLVVAKVIPAHCRSKGKLRCNIVLISLALNSKVLSAVIIVPSQIKAISLLTLNPL